MNNTMILLSSFVAVSLILPLKVLSHGDHIFFETPTKMEHIQGTVNFKLLAPYSDIPKIHLKIHKEASETATAQYFLVLNEKSKSYAQSVNVSGWEEGTYCAEVTQLGAVYTHNANVCFVVE